MEDFKFKVIAEANLVPETWSSLVVVSWGKNDLRIKEVSLPITKESAHQGLTIHFKAKVVGPAKSWLKPNLFASVGVLSLRSE